MASMMMTIMPSEFHYLLNSNRSSVRTCFNHVPSRLQTSGANFCSTQQNLCKRLLFSCNHLKISLRHVSKPILAVGSGLEASITDPGDNSITLKDAKIVVESRDENKIQLRVELPGDETQKVFDIVLKNLARAAPPVPGFRRQKGGKTSKVPSDFLLRILGEERVTKFVIQEIVNSTMADYVKKENLNVKDKKINTTQTAEELKRLFSPGNEFGFNAVLELETSEIEISSSSSAETEM